MYSYSHELVLMAGTGPRYLALYTFGAWGRGSGHCFRAGLGMGSFGPGLFENNALGSGSNQPGLGQFRINNMFRVNEWNESTIKIPGF